jgi:hypothetical protein
MSYVNASKQSWFVIVGLALGGAGLGCGNEVGSDRPEPTSETAEELDLAGDPLVAADVEGAPTADDLAELAEHAGDVRIDGVLAEKARVPAATEAPKYAAVRANTARLGLHLDVESDSDEVPAAANNLAATTVTHAVHIQGAKQSRSDWCVPASGYSMLSTFDSTPPSQTTLAVAMHTHDGHYGTYFSDVPRVLNRYEKRNTYILSTIHGTSDLLNLVFSDVGYMHAALMAGVRGAYLPTWAAHGYDGNHAIVLYGWIQKGSAYWIKTWDPLHVSWSGAHAFRGYTVSSAIKHFNSTVIW